MTAWRLLPLLAAIVLLALLGWGVTVGLQRLVGPDPAPIATPEPPPPAATARIEATIFYGTPDGQALVGVRREVELADDILAQGREILRHQLQPAPAPYVSVIPEGTVLRAFYVTDRGEAFVDLSSEITTAHPGGSMTELLTVYALVNAVTANLPALERVQLLVEGREVETIAGHVDVRRPLSRDPSLVQAP
jgi:spore germination protein GerM